MASFNKVILVGNMTRDPELRFTPKGMAVAKFGLAVNRTWRTEAGEQKEEVTFVDIDAWGRTAENLGQYKRKGDPLLVEGRLKLDQWDDKQTGQKRSKLGVVAETITYLSKGGGGEDGDGGERREQTRGTRPPAGAASHRQAQEREDEPPMPEDDVPFLSNNAGNWFAGFLRTAREAWQSVNIGLRRVTG